MVASSLGHKYHLLYIYAAGQQFYTYADFSPLPRTRTRMWLGLVIRNEVHFNDAHKSAPRGEILWCSFPLSKIHNKLSYTDVVRVCVCVCVFEYAVFGVRPRQRTADARASNSTSGSI